LIGAANVFLFRYPLCIKKLDITPLPFVIEVQDPAFWRVQDISFIFDRLPITFDGKCCTGPLPLPSNWIFGCLHLEHNSMYWLLYIELPDRSCVYSGAAPYLANGGPPIVSMHAFLCPLNLKCSNKDLFYCGTSIMAVHVR